MNRFLSSVTLLSALTLTSCANPKFPGPSLCDEFDFNQEPASHLGKMLDELDELEKTTNKTQFPVTIKSSDKDQ